MNSQGQGAILDSSYRLTDSSNPAVAGSTYIQIFCTGLGPVTNQPATGAAASAQPLSYTTTVPTVTIGGIPAAVLFSGLTPTTVGLYQINVQVPARVPSGDAVPVMVKIGTTTSNIVAIAVQGVGQSATNPAPLITSLSPSSVPAGSNPLTLTINGSGFLGSSIVMFNGVAHAVMSQSASALTITLAASDLFANGSFPIVVTNPSPGGGISPQATFTVTVPTSVNLTGNFMGAWGSLASPGIVGLLSATLIEDNSAPSTYIQGIPAYTVTGTVTLNSSLCFGEGVISAGYVAANVFAFMVTFAGQQVTIDGYSNATGTAIPEGAYKVSSGLCEGDYGIFSATKK